MSCLRVQRRALGEGWFVGSYHRAFVWVCRITEQGQVFYDTNEWHSFFEEGVWVSLEQATQLYAH